MRGVGRWRAVGVVCVGVLAAACAGRISPGEAVVVRERDAQWVYERPLEEVWPAARALLEERGYVVREPAQPTVLETDWKDEADGQRSSRYHVVGEALGPASCVLRFERHTRAAVARPAGVASEGRGGSGLPAPPPALNRAGAAPR